MNVEERFLDLQTVCAALEATPASRNFKQGEDLVNSHHIVSCDASKKTETEIYLHATCLQSSVLSADPHSITGILKVTQHTVTVTGMQCTCKAGTSGKCKHVAGVLIYCTRNNIRGITVLSPTDMKCKWSVKKGPALQQYQPKPLMQTECFSCHANSCGDTNKSEFFLKKLMESAPNSALNKHRSGRSQRSKEITDTVATSSENTEQRRKGTFCDIMVAPLLDEKDNVTMASIASLEILPLHDCCIEFYEENIVCEDTLQLCKTTFYNNSEWSNERKYRITGSRAYSIFTYETNKNPDWTQKSVKYFWPKLFKNQNMIYGQVFESMARNTYKNCYECEVLELGLVVSQKNPWLAYSPDGIIIKYGEPIKLLEIKCPVSGKEMTIKEVAKGLRFLKEERAEFVLNKKHQYYGQVQLGMAVLNLSQTDFVIFASKDNSFINIPIQRDDDFINKFLYSLKMSYFTKMLHNICVNKLN